MPATLAPPPPKTTSQTPSPATKPAGDIPPTVPGSPDPHEPSPDNYLGDIGEELGALDAADTESKKQEAPKRGEDGKFKKAAEAQKQPKEASEPEKGAETPPEPEKPVEEERPNNVRGLGKLLDEKTRLINKELQPKIQSLESKVKDYETKLEQLTKAQPDLKPFQEKMAAIEKENQQLREVVRFADYKKSPEFVEKYEKPYNEAWSKAVSEVTQLSITMEDGVPRKATANDLLALANAPLDQLDDLAAQWFPKSSPRVIRHVEKIRDLAEAQDKALAEAQKGAGEFYNKQTKSIQEANQAFTQAYQGANTELTTKYPKIFGPDEADPKGNELLKKGFEFADTIFSPNGNQLPPDKKAGRLALIRAKAANHDREYYRRKSAEARVAELEAKLKEYEDSAPPTDTAGQPGTVSTGDWQDDIAAEFKKLDR